MDAPKIEIHPKSDLYHQEVPCSLLELGMDLSYTHTEFLFSDSIHCASLTVKDME